MCKPDSFISTSLISVYAPGRCPSWVKYHLAGYNKVTIVEVAMPNVYPSQHPLVAHKLTRLRDKRTDPKRFRELVREMAALLTYEATMDLQTVPRPVETP